MPQDIDHVRRGHRRTTVSLDRVVSILLSLKLGYCPGTEEAYAAVRSYLQAKFDENNHPPPNRPQPVAPRTGPPRSPR